MTTTTLTSPPTLESLRHARQLAFAGSDNDLVVGSLHGLPWTASDLRAVGSGTCVPAEHVGNGLTAIVWRLHADGRDFTLKRAREQALVRNVDGQTSFLNEVQRRADFERLKRERGGDRHWAFIVDTHYASYREGVILSSWIEGDLVHDWDERRLTQVLGAACQLWLEGLFEWDFSPGNLLDDGEQVRLFDFGYMYRFDPRRHFNTAGHGTDQPMFHPAERFETRNFCAHLLKQERQQGQDAALALFRLEKTIALSAYRMLHSEAALNGSNADVLDWLDGWIVRWQQALRGDLGALYLAENWRSHVLDLDDDLRGQTCTPMTLQRVDWVLAALQDHFGDLQRMEAFFGHDAGCVRDELITRYRALRRTAESFLVDPLTR